MAYGYAGKKYYGKNANGQRRLDDQKIREKAIVASWTPEQKAADKTIKLCNAAKNQAVADQTAGLITYPQMCEIVKAENVKIENARKAFAK